MPVERALEPGDRLVRRDREARAVLGDDLHPRERRPRGILAEDRGEDDPVPARDGDDRLGHAPEGTRSPRGRGLFAAGADPRKFRASAAEDLLRGTRPDAASIAEAARLAGEAASPNPDRRGTVEYKRNMTRVLAGRALTRALDRAKES